MKVMLNYVAIDSYVTLIKAGTDAAEIKKDFPSQQYNHVILAIPLVNGTIWLENTSNSLPFNYPGTFTMGRYAFTVVSEVYLESIVISNTLYNSYLKQKK